MKIRLVPSLAALSLALPLLVQGQAIDRTTVLRDARKTRLDARVLRATSQLVKLGRAAPQAPSTTLGLGLAIDEDELGTRTITTPFELSHRRGGDEDWWVFKLQGDGYGRSREAGSDAVTGLAELQFKVLHLLGAGFTAGAGLTLPTGGAIGSTSASQSAKLVYEYTYARVWNALTSVSLIHANGSTADQSPYTKVLYAELGREISAGHTLIANLARTQRGGMAASTELGVEYDFPFPLIGKAKKIDASLSWVRGISRGSRHTALELSLSHSF